MKATIQYLKKELAEFYPDSEIAGFTRIILESVCGLGYSDQILNPERKISAAEFEKIEMIVDRLKKLEPIQYIIGETEFYGLKIRVNKSVLIPRQETEELVDWIVKNNLPVNCNVLDIGTGSGCIALAVKKNLKSANVFAMDISNEALKVARNNALENGLEINFFQGDILNPDNSKFDIFDVIISNPPYVRNLEKAEMQNNVLKYEPELALFVSDEDPLMYYRAITKFASNHLRKNGKLYFEINEYMGEEMVQMVNRFEFSDMEIKKDINGKKRMLYCRKKL